MKRLAALILSLITMMGCGRKPASVMSPSSPTLAALRFDASTNATTIASAKAIEDQLTVEERAEYNASVKTLTQERTERMARDKIEHPEHFIDISISSLCQPLHGLTVKEINAKAKAARATAAASPKPTP